MSEALRQQINLFQPRFRKERQIFSAVTMFQSIGVIVVALVTVYVYAALQLGMLEAQVVELEGVERARSVQLASLDTSSGPARRAQVQSELDSLNAMLAGQQRLIEVLEEQPPGSTTGFSKYLESLAMRRRSGVWLTEITINGAREALELRGRSLDVRRIPEYLAALTDGEALSGQRFDEFSIERTDDGDIAFHVTSAAVAEPADASSRGRP